MSREWLALGGVLITICATASAGTPPTYDVTAGSCPCDVCGVVDDQPVSFATECTIGNITRSLQGTSGFGVMDLLATVDDYCVCGTIPGEFGGGAGFEVYDLVFSGPPGETTVATSYSVVWDLSEEFSFTPGSGGYTDHSLLLRVHDLWITSGPTNVWVPPGTYTSRTGALPLNVPLSVYMRAGVRCVTQSWPGSHALVSCHGRLGFRPGQPVFNLPPGYTANSPSLNIVNNFWVPPPDPADFDGDGDVDTGDFAVFAQCFGGALNPPAASCPAGVDADLDDDGDVDAGDFAIFAANFTGSL